MPSSNLIRKDKWPLHLAVAAFLLPTILLAYHLLQNTGGAFSLPRDEAFLQLSTAKTLAFRHVWGIGRYDFASASPSLLYPLVLAAAFFIFGAQLILVPVVNTAIAILLLIAIQQWLAKRAIRPVNQLFILLSVVALTPLPLIVIYGMERPLLLLFAFLFVSRLSDEWAMPEFSQRTLIYGALMVATRYDGVFLIAAVSLLLIYRRKWLEAFELALWSLLPILVFGIIALFKGSYFLPNAFMVEPAGRLLSYDWLVGCGVAVAVPLLSHYATKPLTRKTSWITGLSALVIALTLFTRNLYAFRESDRSSLAVHRLTYPAAQFTHRYYHRYGIVSDDMGIISYLTEGRYLDLSGLSSIKIARGKTDKYLNPGLIYQLSQDQNSQLAIISDRYDKGLPESWIRTASWKMPALDGYDKKTISFYAVDSSAATLLEKNLVAYTSFLPRNITVQYFYSPPAEKKEP